MFLHYVNLAVPPNEFWPTFAITHRMQFFKIIVINIIHCFWHKSAQILNFNITMIWWLYTVRDILSDTPGTKNVDLSPQVLCYVPLTQILCIQSDPAVQPL